MSNQAEPEYCAIPCEFLIDLAGRRFSAAADAQRKNFEEHPAPRIGPFFANWERAEAADFCRHVSAVYRLLLAIETEAFALPA